MKEWWEVQRNYNDDDDDDDDDNKVMMIAGTPARRGDSRANLPWLRGRRIAGNNLINPYQLHGSLLKRGLQLIKQRPARLPRPATSNKLFSKYPTKSEIRQIVQHWTGGDHNLDIARARRTGVKLDKAGLQVDWALVTYMRNFSLRAPFMPIGAKDPLDSRVAPKYLYRGVKWSAGWYAGQGLRRWTWSTPLGKIDKSYSSWSTNPEAAAIFGSSLSDALPPRWKRESTRVYRLDISNIARGTPWIWFARKGASLRNGWNISLLGDSEGEVLLPPGTLTYLSMSNRAARGRRIAAALGSSRVTVIDVRFDPDIDATALWTPPGRKPMRIFRYQNMQALRRNSTRALLVSAKRKSEKKTHP